ncbi:MAG: hypothetical protein H6662_03690 [Ardenticatenaceae bacterium]|nr:hypothetical protein [Ardenticatenaceae bacterium]MCB9002919.1 hypothetical protein [Ardenticatenaceae bacterium]
MWKENNGTSNMLSDGLFTDQFLLEILIRVEFNGLSSNSRIYEAALEALYRQYAGYGGGGGCSSLGQQLKWLDGMQGWYGRNGNKISVADCPRCSSDASRVMTGVDDHDGYEAFWWGNPTPGSAMDNYITNIDSTGRETPSWGDDSLSGAFIVQAPIAGGGDYNRFLVVTWDQNNACGSYSESHSCMGFRNP